MADILPSPDAEQLIDFTCESPWERFALDVELVFRAWKLRGSEVPDSVPISNTSAPTSAPVSGLELPALAACSLSLAGRSFVIQLRNDAHDTSLDAAPLQRLLGTPSCIVLLSGSGDAPVAWDMSDAASLLSALSVAASACDVTLPLVVPVGRASEFRLIGRRAGARSARFCCDCNAFVPDALGHLAGLLALFESKRGAARRSLPLSQRSARISAKFTYTWSDFSLRVPAPLSQHRDASAAAAARRLAAVHADALAGHDPVRTLRLAALWDAFPAHELQRSADRAAMRAVAADRIRVAAVLPGGARAARAAAATAPLAAPPRACVRLALRGDNDGAPAAATSLVRAVQDDVRGDVDAFAVVRSLFFADARSVLAAAALSDKAVDDEFVAGALAALFDMIGMRGLMGDVVDALGPLAAELPLLERLARLMGALADANSVSLLWQLFVDGVEIHWTLRMPLPGVAADPQGRPLLYDTIISQKLQMINCCVLREQTDARARNFRERNTTGRKKRIDNVSLVGAGADGEVWEPHVQPSSLVTRDLVEAQHDRMVSAQDGNERSKEEMRTLTSDMSAFKAANPDVEMADFVRWFSPSDWITDDDAATMAAVATADGNDVPSGSSEERRGGRLSARMCKPGNEWEMLWQAAKAVPAHQQAALFDTNMHGTDAVRDLRQMPLCAVLLQLGCLCGAGGARTLHDALAGSDLPLPLVCGQAESARAAFRTFAATTVLGYANQEKMREDADMLSDAVAALASAERAALTASSLRTKLPDVGEFRRAIDALAVGGSFELVGSSERALLARIARLDDADWRAALLPEHREFLLVGDDGEMIANGIAAAGADGGDRMYARLSSDEFRTAFRLCVDYGV